MLLFYGSPTSDSVYWEPCNGDSLRWLLYPSSCSPCWWDLTSCGLVLPQGSTAAANTCISRQTVPRTKRPRWLSHATAICYRLVLADKHTSAILTLFGNTARLVGCFSQGPATNMPRLMHHTMPSLQSTHPGFCPMLRRPCTGKFAPSLAGSGAAVSATAVSWLGPLAYTTCRGLPWLLVHSLNDVKQCNDICQWEKYNEEKGAAWLYAWFTGQQGSSRAAAVGVRYVRRPQRHLLSCCPGVDCIQR